MVNVGEYSIHRAYGYDYILSFSKVSRVQILFSNFSKVTPLLRIVHAEIFVENESGKAATLGRVCHLLNGVSRKKTKHDFSSDLFHQLWQTSLEWSLTSRATLICRNPCFWQR